MFELEIEIGNRVRLRKGKKTQKPNPLGPARSPFFFPPRGPVSPAFPPLFFSRVGFARPVAHPALPTAAARAGPASRLPLAFRVRPTPPRTAPPRPASRRGPRRSLPHCAPGPTCRSCLPPPVFPARATESPRRTCLSAHAEIPGALPLIGPPRTPLLPILRPSAARRHGEPRKTPPNPASHPSGLRVLW